MSSEEPPFTVADALAADMRLKLRAQYELEQMEIAQKAKAMRQEYDAIKAQLKVDMERLEKIEMIKKMVDIKPDASLTLMFCRECEQLQHAIPTGVCSECKPPPLVIQEEELG